MRVPSAPPASSPAPSAWWGTAPTATTGGPGVVTSSVGSATQCRSTERLSRTNLGQEECSKRQLYLTEGARWKPSIKIEWTDRKLTLDAVPSEINNILYFIVSHAHNLDYNIYESVDSVVCASVHSLIGTDFFTLVLINHSRISIRMCRTW